MKCLTSRKRERSLGLVSTPLTWNARPRLEALPVNAAYPGQARHARVVHALGAAIVRGELGPGSPVPTEDELVSRFEVGRSALREGVKVLAGKGLLESRTSAGTRVRPRESWNLLDPDVLRWRYSEDPSPADIRALADLRVALEPGAARLAAESASAAQRGVIAAAMATLWATVESPDEFIAADLAFHRAVFAACENDLLLYIHDVVSVALGAIRPLHTLSVAHNRETLPTHQRVADAIQRGYHRKAEAAMREIVEGARADLIREQDADLAREQDAEGAGTP
jgi:DNA-binding FadR family transcriptional regulator